jgi:hypothetical protein
MFDLLLCTLIIFFFLYCVLKKLATMEGHSTKETKDTLSKVMWPSLKMNWMFVSLFWLFKGADVYRIVKCIVSGLPFKLLISHLFLYNIASDMLV